MISLADGTLEGDDCELLYELSPNGVNAPLPSGRPGAFRRRRAVRVAGGTGRRRRRAGPRNQALVVRIAHQPHAAVRGHRASGRRLPAQGRRVSRRLDLCQPH